MSRIKGISQMIALLIILAIVVGVGVAIGSIIPSILQKNIPKGGEIIIQQVELTSTGPPRTRQNFAPTHRLEILIRGIYEGNSDIEIKRIYTQYEVAQGNIYIFGFQNVTVDFDIKSSRYYKPNSYLKIYGVAEAPAPPEEPVLVYVEYCFAGTDQCDIRVFAVKPLLNTSLSYCLLY